MNFTDEPEFGVLTRDIPDRLGPRFENIFAKIAWAASRIGHIVQDPDVHLTIELTVPVPRCTSCFQNEYGNHLLFSQARDRILIPSRYLDAAPPENEESLFGLIKLNAMAEVEKVLSLQDPIARIKAAINEHFKAGDCKLERLPEALGYPGAACSVTWKRRERAFGTSPTGAVGRWHPNICAIRT